MNNEYLKHYGVKGMKWGVRRYQPYSQTGGRKSGKSGKEIGKAAKKAAMLASPTGYAAYKGVKSYRKYKQKRFDNSDYSKAKTMSDQELRERINRINLEQNYVSAMQRDREAHKAAGQTVLSTYGSKSVKYIKGVPNNKEFKKRVAKKAAIALIG